MRLYAGNSHYIVQNIHSNVQKEDKIRLDDFALDAGLIKSHKFLELAGSSLKQNVLQQWLIVFCHIP